MDISTVRCFNYTITYVLSGSMTVTLPLEQVRISAGEMIFLERGEYCMEHRSHERGIYRDITIEFGESELVNALTLIGKNNSGTLERAVHRCYRCKHRDVLVTSSAKMSLYFEMLAQYMESGNFDFNNYTFKILKLSELFCVILSLEEHVCVGGRLLRGATDNVNIIDKTIKENILSNCSVRDMARVCGMGISTFKSEFSSRYGTSPHRWLIEQRLSHARFLLLSTTYTVADISRQCRFSNSSHLIKQFKRFYGMTPRTFRRNLIKNS